MFKGFDNQALKAPEPIVEVAPIEADLAKDDLRQVLQDEFGPQAWLELKSHIHEQLLEKLNLAMLDKVEPASLRRQVAALASDFVKSQNTLIGADRFKKLTDELIDEVMGLGPLEPLLADPSVADILVNGCDNVFVERGGVLEKTSVRFRDERHLLRVIDKVVSSVGRRIDESQPWVDARLEDGSRVNAIVRPCAIDGPSLSIRKFSKSPLRFEQLVENGALSRPAANFLRAVVQARMNVVISGGTGSGKTTMLNAMSSYIDQRQRVVTIEDAAELQLQQEHVVRLETRPPNTEGVGAIYQRDLLKNALRMRPDRIIVGEVRGNEAFDMLQAMNTGHDGSMTTVHANTARDAVSRLEQMVAMIGGDFPLDAIRAQISAGINIIIQLSRLSDGRRQVMSISEITGMEGNIVSLQDIFVFRRKGRSEDGEIFGTFEATEIRPRCMEQLTAAGIELPTNTFTNGLRR